MHQITRYHDISMGHRVHGHESKCKHLHGHNYRVHFTCTPDRLDDLDNLGRVIDFSVIKTLLCEWLELNWDHKFLASDEDYVMVGISHLVKSECDAIREYDFHNILSDSLVFVPFNPTAENMAQYLVDVIGPKQLEGTCVTLSSVVIEETRKCSATYIKE